MTIGDTITYRGEPSRHLVWGADGKRHRDTGVRRGRVVAVQEGYVTVVSERYESVPRSAIIEEAS